MCCHGNITRYSLSKYVAVVIITAGISMATIASAHQVSALQEEWSCKVMWVWFWVWFRRRVE